MVLKHRKFYTEVFHDLFVMADSHNFAVDANDHLIFEDRLTA